MIRTRVGYSGGKKDSPTYRDMGDHSETIQIDYDPSQMTYERLLAEFWSSQMPLHPAWSNQYRSAIFYHDEEQRKLALQSKELQEERYGSKLYTSVEAATTFYLAEDYHQKYRVRREALLLRDLEARYPTASEFVNSTAAARINGYLAGYGTTAQLVSEIEEFGLSPRGRDWLLQFVSRREARSR